MHQFNAIQSFSIWVLPVLFAITLHEAAHGWIATKLGDKTALMLGRVSINPLKHIDPLGTILIPTILFFLGGFIFGWAKPVPVTWENLRNPKRDMAIVAAAGPVANFLMALFWAIIAKIGISIGNGQGVALAMIYVGKAGILINTMLAILNLIPIPPLDGSRIISSILPNKWDYYYAKLEPYGFFIILILLATNILVYMIYPPVLFLFQAIVELFGIPVSQMM